MPSSPRPPLSPEAVAVVRALSSGRLSRRSMLGGAGAVGLAAALAACGTSSTRASVSAAARPAPAADVSDTDKVVRWANFPLYLDKNEDSQDHPTLQQFRAKTGITPTYVEEIDDNESYDAKIQPSLSTGADFGRDLIVFTDWMAAQVVRAGWVQRLDKARNIPNAVNILDRLKNVDFDPGRSYSLTWQSGYTGLGWNVRRLKDLTGKTRLSSVDDLWDPRLKGRVEVLSEMRDTIGLIMLSQGVGIDGPFPQEAFDNAVTLLEKQLADGQIRAVLGNSYKADLVSGDAVAVIGWSGDLFQLNTEAKAADGSLTSDPYGFALPESGGVLWSDDLLVPLGSSHKTNAEILLNYYYDPQVAAQVAAYVSYVCPVKGAQAEITKLPGVSPDVAESPYIFPTAADLATVHAFRTLTTQEEQDFTAAFRSVLGV